LVVVWVRARFAEVADEVEAHFGEVHVLVNNAGVSVFGPTDEASYDDYDWMMGVNFGGVVNGLLLDHFQMQDVITVAPDRKTAKGRFHGILLGGWHDDFQETREEMMPQQFMEAGIYENDYVNVDGVWKIKRLDYMMQWQANYEEGWAHTTAHLQPAAKTFPEDPLGPDVLLPPEQHRETWPFRQDVPMHFAHPKFGALLAGQEKK
jgi:hypothetical protein